MPEAKIKIGMQSITVGDGADRDAVPSGSYVERNVPEPTVSKDSVYYADGQTEALNPECEGNQQVVEVPKDPMADPHGRFGGLEENQTFIESPKGMDQEQTAAEAKSIRRH